MEKLNSFVPICGNRVRELRMKKNWTLNQLASEIGMTRQGISRIENGELGKTQCRDRTRKNLTIKLDCTVQYICGITDEVRGTGTIITKDNGDEIELLSPMFSPSFINNLSLKTELLFAEHGEIIKLFLEIISRMKPEENQIILSFFKALPSYSKYQSLKKSALADSIIDEMYKKNFTTEVYEIIYQTISETKIREIKRRRLSKADFQIQLKQDLGGTILGKVNTKMEMILENAFDIYYSPKRVKKNFITAHMK